MPTVSEMKKAIGKFKRTKLAHSKMKKTQLAETVDMLAPLGLKVASKGGMRKVPVAKRSMKFKRAQAKLRKNLKLKNKYDDGEVSFKY